MRRGLYAPFDKQIGKLATMTQHNKHFYKSAHAIMEFDVDNWSCGNKNLQMLIQVGM